MFVQVPDKLAPMSPTAHARERIGTAIRAERKSRSLSIEAAAKAGGIGHMTWRKIEQGGSVHDQSYYAVDRAFGWESGHTRAVVEHETVDLIPAPAARDAPEPSTHKPTQQAPHEETSAIPREEHDPSSDAFYRVIENIDLLSLSELRAISSVVDVRLRGRTEILDRIKNKIGNIDWPIPMFNTQYMLATSPEVSKEYQTAYEAYMNAWGAMQEIAKLANEYETRRAASVPDLQQVWERTLEAERIFNEAMQRFNAAEEAAISHQEYELIPHEPRLDKNEMEKH